MVVAAACVAAAVGAYRFLLHPLLASALSLDDATSSLVRRFGIFAAIVLSYWGFVHFYERRKAQELAPRPGWTLLAGIAGAISIGVTILVLCLTGHYQVLAYRGFGAAGDMFGVLLIAAVLEEVGFRAILFRTLEERLGTRSALVASALVFSVVHLSNAGAGWISLVTVTLAGLMWCCVFILSRNVWVTAAHHLCWNFTIFLMGVPLSGDTDVRAKAPFETVYRGSDYWTGGVFGPENSVVNIVVSTLICVVLLWLVRSKFVRGYRSTQTEAVVDSRP